MEKDKIAEEVYSFICDAFHDVLLIAIKEEPDKLPYTVATINFIKHLRKYNIKVNFGQTFQGEIIDRIFRENENFLSK